VYVFEALPAGAIMLGLPGLGKEISPLQSQTRLVSCAELTAELSQKVSQDTDYQKLPANGVTITNPVSEQCCRFRTDFAPRKDKSVPALN
jgi:hypothetical protein